MKEKYAYDKEAISSWKWVDILFYMRSCGGVFL
jgi:hypothetical protein